MLCIKESHEIFTYIQFIYSVCFLFNKWQTLYCATSVCENFLLVLKGVQTNFRSHRFSDLHIKSNTSAVCWRLPHPEFPYSERRAWKHGFITTSFIFWCCAVCGENNCQEILHSQQSLIWRADDVIFTVYCSQRNICYCTFSQSMSPSSTGPYWLCELLGMERTRRVSLQGLKMHQHLGVFSISHCPLPACRWPF